MNTINESVEPIVVNILNETVLVEQDVIFEYADVTDPLACDDVDKTLPSKELQNCKQSFVDGQDFHFVDVGQGDVCVREDQRKLTFIFLNKSIFVWTINKKRTRILKICH